MPQLYSDAGDKRRSALINGRYRVVRYLFFSLSGYTDWFEQLNDDRVVLLTLDDLFQEK